MLRVASLASTRRVASELGPYGCSKKPDRPSVGVRAATSAARGVLSKSAIALVAGWLPASGSVAHPVAMTAAHAATIIPAIRDNACSMCLAGGDPVSQAILQ